MEIAVDIGESGFKETGEESEGRARGRKVRRKEREEEVWKSTFFFMGKTFWKGWHEDRGGRGMDRRVGLMITWRELWCHLIGDLPHVIRQRLINDVGGS